MGDNSTIGLYINPRKTVLFASCRGQKSVKSGGEPRLRQPAPATNYGSTDNFFGFATADGPVFGRDRHLGREAQRPGAPF